MFALRSSLTVAAIASLAALAVATPVDLTHKAKPIRCISTSIEGLDIYGVPAMLSGKVTPFSLAAGKTAVGYFGENYEQDGQDGVKLHVETNWDKGTLTLRNEGNKGDIPYVYMMSIQTSNRDGPIKTTAVNYYLFHDDECETTIDGALVDITVSAIVPKDGSKTPPRSKGGDHCQD